MHYPDVPYLEKSDFWLTVCNDRLGYCLGYLQARRDSPLLCGAMRLVRHADGKVLKLYPARTEIGVGMIAGYPTGLQQLEAVRRTLQKVRVHRNYVTEEEAELAAKALRCLGAPGEEG